MSMSDRAAQFSPFAALTGYDASIDEAGRLVGSRNAMTDDAKDELDRIMNVISGDTDKQYMVKIAYFHRDLRKDGGSYEEFRGTIKHIDRYSGKLVFTDGTEIPLVDLSGMEVLS